MGALIQFHGRRMPDGSSYSPLLFGFLRVMSMAPPVWAQPPLPRARCRTAGPGTGSSVPSPVVFRTALRERRAVERDGHPCPHLGRVAVLGVQTCWILSSERYGLRGERAVVHAPSAHSCMKSAANWASSPERGRERPGPGYRRRVAGKTRAPAFPSFSHARRVRDRHPRGPARGGRPATAEVA